jgi:hypothetical protein
MPVSTRIYASCALAFGGQPAVDDLKASGYSTVLVWSVHVDAYGSLYLNDTLFVFRGAYKETQPMDLPARLAQLRTAGVEVLFSVGAGETSDFTNIGKLLHGGVPGPGNPLYDNFNALRCAMLGAGGDIDGIDLDNEDNVDPSVMVNFGRMLHDIGYPHVTLCPYDDLPVWTDTLTQLNKSPGVGFVNAVHLQCYSGGSGNAKKVQSWQNMITKTGSASRCLLIPGLATMQPNDGPWWYNGSPGKSVGTRSGVAMDGRADWSRYLRTEYYLDERAALQGAQSYRSATFFFYCHDLVDLGPGKRFQAGDAVFFSGEPSWCRAPQCAAFSLSLGCQDSYNPDNLGACPSDLQRQFKTWSAVKPRLQGGFIWFYDSVVQCLLSGCCSGTEPKPVTTAGAYRDAIVNGLSPSGRGSRPLSKRRHR